MKTMNNSMAADEKMEQRARVHSKVLAMPECDAGNLIGPPMKCELPPDGWYCTRMPGHEGPCAARAVAPGQAQEPTAEDYAAVFADEVLDQVMKERDDNEDMANKLADSIAEYFGVDIGEHSSGNCPWVQALDLLNTKPEFIDCAGSKRAAAPVQPVAVPDGWKLVPIDATRAMIDAASAVEEDGFCAMHKAMLDAAPAAPVAQGDAKESINAELLAALKDITDDICERFDMGSSSTNPGIKNCVERALTAIAAKAAS